MYNCKNNNINKSFKIMFKMKILKYKKRKKPFRY